MFAKCVVLILSIGLIACALLVARHQRLRVASEMVRAQQRLIEHERTYRRIRAQIAECVSNEELPDRVGELGDLQYRRLSSTDEDIEGEAASDVDVDMVEDVGLEQQVVAVDE